MHQISVFVVVCLVAASNAAVLNREIGSTFFDDGEQSTDIGKKYIYSQTTSYNRAKGT